MRPLPHKQETQKKKLLVTANIPVHNIKHITKAQHALQLEVSAQLHLHEIYSNIPLNHRFFMWTNTA